MKSIALLLSLVLYSCSSSQTKMSNDTPALVERPNIIFIFTDDHSHNAISAYGSKVNKTPNIDRLAADGMLFKNSFVTNSICGPCRAVIQTGKHSHLNGFMANGNHFNGDQQTFPKLLQKAGYQTALIGKWHLHTTPQGFDHWEVLPGQGHYYNPDFLTKKGKVTEAGYVTDIITDKSLAWLGQRDSSKPFMLMLQHKAPHREWEPAAKYLTKYDGETIPEPSNLFDDYKTRGWAAKNQDMTIAKTMTLTSDNKVWELDPKKKHWGYKRTHGRLNSEQRKAWDAAYQAKNKQFLKANLKGKDLVRWKYQRYIKDYIRCIDSVDDSVGKVMDYLKANGLEKNTIVIYSSDQSFYLGEHGWFDKRFMYEESMRTPLIIKWPGITAAGSKCEKMVQNLDYAQTFLDIAGTAAPSDMQGNSLMPLLKSQKTDWRDALYYHYYQGAKSTHRVARHHGVRTERYKLIHFYRHGYWELYDLEQDPKEMNNLYGRKGMEKLTAELKQKLQGLTEHYKVPAEHFSSVK